MADVEDPAGIGPVLARHRTFNVLPGEDLGIDRLLEEPVVEKARQPISLAVHCNETNQARGWIEGLGKPGGVSGDFIWLGSAGHGAH